MCWSGSLPPKACPPYTHRTAYVVHLHILYIEARGSMVSADRISSLVLVPPALNTSQTGASRLPAAASVHRQLGSLVSRCRCAVCRAHRYPPRAPPNRAQSPSTAVASYHQHLPTYPLTSPYPLTSRAALGVLTSDSNPCGKVRLHSQLCLTPNPNPNPDPDPNPNPNPNAEP